MKWKYNRKAFEKQVRQFLEKSGCGLVNCNGRAFFGKSNGPDLLVCCNGWMIGIWLDAPEDREAEPWHWERADFPDRYGILLSPERFVLFRNFISCILAGDIINAGYNYDLLRLSQEEMRRLIR